VGCYRISRMEEIRKWGIHRVIPVDKSGGNVISGSNATLPRTTPQVKKKVKGMAIG
jgi:hypothetical protein